LIRQDIRLLHILIDHNWFSFPGCILYDSFSLASSFPCRRLFIFLFLPFAFFLAFSSSRYLSFSSGEALLLKAFYLLSFSGLEPFSVV